MQTLPTVTPGAPLPHPSLLPSTQHGRADCGLHHVHGVDRAQPGGCRCHRLHGAVCQQRTQSGWVMLFASSTRKAGGNLLWKAKWHLGAMQQRWPSCACHRKNTYSLNCRSRISLSPSHGTVPCGVRFRSACPPPAGDGLSQPVLSGRRPGAASARSHTTQQGAQRPRQPWQQPAGCLAAAHAGPCACGGRRLHLPLAPAGVPACGRLLHHLHVCLRPSVLQPCPPGLSSRPRAVPARPAIQAPELAAGLVGHRRCVSGQQPAVAGVGERGGCARGGQPAAAGDCLVWGKA